MPVSLTHRRREPEWMDADDVDPKLLERSLRFIRRVNVMLGYTRATIAHLERFSKNWKPGETIRLIDLATGSADIPRAILRWADRKKFDVRIVAVDRHAATARTAIAQAPPDSRLQIVQADVLAMPFDDNSFDYALTAMFLHHLDDDQVTQVMHTMGRLSRRGVIVADLLRNRRALFWIKLFTKFSNPMVQHDAAVSVMQAFTREEIQAMRDRAEISFAAYHRHFGHRFVLAGEK